MLFSLHSETCSISSLGGLSRGVFFLPKIEGVFVLGSFCPGGFCPGEAFVLDSGKMRIAKNQERVQFGQFTAAIKCRTKGKVRKIVCGKNNLSHDTRTGGAL